MSQFRSIDYGKMLYEALRSYFSVNSNGEISILFKFIYGCIFPIQKKFDEYVDFRNKKQIIANCKWQIGQLTNVLNYFFDSTLKRIYITQSNANQIVDVTFEYNAINFDLDFSQNAEIYEPIFGGQALKTSVIIMVPSGIDLNLITSVVEQVKMNGIPYTIQTF